MFSFVGSALEWWYASFASAEVSFSRELQGQIPVMRLSLERRTVAHIRRACPTISTRTFLASSGLLTSRKNAMRAPRVPSWVFKRT